MNRFGNVVSRISLPFFAIAVILTAVSNAAEKKSGSEGPQLVAEAPPKREIPKYDLHYKLSRGDVLRYDVTHEASISGTSDNPKAL